MRDVQDCDLVVAQIENSETREVLEVFQLGDAIVVEVEDVQTW